MDRRHGRVLPFCDHARHGLGVAELVVLGGQDQFRARVARRERAPLDHRRRWRDNEPCRHERMRRVECHGGPEGVTGHQDRPVGFDHVGELTGRGEVEPLAVPVIVHSARVAHPAEVDRDGVASERVGGALHRRHHVVVSVAAVEGVRMADHEGRSDLFGVGAHEVGLDQHAVDRLEGNGFGRHRPDGTVRCVQDETQRLPIKMLNDRLLVRIPQSEGERRSSGGILIPATAQISKRLVWAEVVALGANVRAAEAGDQVLFSPDDRYEVEVGGTDYIMLRERDIHAVAAARNEASTGLYI